MAAYHSMDALLHAYFSNHCKDDSIFSIPPTIDELRTDDNLLSFTSTQRDDCRYIPARAHVFGLPELLEAILLNLSQDTGFSRISNHVSPYWKAIVEKSHRIQRTKLFTQKHIIKRLLDHMSMKELLRAKYVCKAWENAVSHDRQAQEKLFMVSSTPSFAPYEVIQFKVNPAYTLACDDTPQAVPAGRSTLYTLGISNRLPKDHGWSQHQVRNLHPQMYLTQPPCRVALISYGPNYQDWEVISNDKGVTCEMCNAVVKRLAGDNGMPFNFSLLFNTQRELHSGTSRVLLLIDIDPFAMTGVV